MGSGHVVRPFLHFKDREQCVPTVGDVFVLGKGTALSNVEDSLSVEGKM